MNIKLLLITVLFLIFSAPVLSDESDTEIDEHLDISSTTINNTINNVTNNTYKNYSTLNKYNSAGQAMALGVASVDCSYATKRWQAGVGIGYFDGVGAPVAGICKKFNSTLIKFTIGREGKLTGGNIGIMFPLN